MFGFAEGDIEFREGQVLIRSRNKMWISLFKFVVARVEHSDSELRLRVVRPYQREFFKLLGCGSALPRLIEQYGEVASCLVNRFILLENLLILRDRSIGVSELRMANCEIKSRWNMRRVILEYEFILCRGIGPTAASKSALAVL